MRFTVGDLFGWLRNVLTKHLPGAVASAAVTGLIGFLISNFHTPSQLEVKREIVPPAVSIAEVEQLRNERALMLEAIRARRVAEEEATERVKEIRMAAEGARAAISARQEPPRSADMTAGPKEPVLLPPARRTTQSELPREIAKHRPKSLMEATKKVSDPLPLITETVTSPPQAENKGVLTTVVDTAGGLVNKATSAVGSVASWIVGIPGSVKDKIFGEPVANSSGPPVLRSNL